MTTYAWEICSNPYVLVLHTDQRLPTYYEGIKLAPDDGYLVKQIMEIAGVVSVSLFDYRCQIQIGKLFDATKIKREIIRIFEKRYCNENTLKESI